MEQIRSLALAYYEHGSLEMKEMFTKFFEIMDTDGNGTISKKEFTDFIMKNCPEAVSPELFKELDQDRNGSLDFLDVITFCYLFTRKIRVCDGISCKEVLKNVYFTCAVCFVDKREEGSFNLCLKCYSDKNYRHEHSYFLDNYVMLDAAQSEYKMKEQELIPPILEHHHADASLQRSKTFPVQPAHNPNWQHQHNSFQQLHTMGGAHYNSYYVQQHPSNPVGGPYYNPYNVQPNAPAYQHSFHQSSSSYGQNSQNQVHPPNTNNQCTLVKALKAFIQVGSGVATVASIAQCVMM